MSWPKELRDQPAHMVTAVVGLLPVGLWPHPLTFLWCGFLMGFVREVTEEGGAVTLSKIRAALGSVRDLGGWATGGIFAWAIAAALRHGGA